MRKDGELFVCTNLKTGKNICLHQELQQTRELISKLFKIYRFVGRTEAREKRSEERLDKDLHESLNDLDDKRKKDVENLINKFHAMTNTLVKDLSLFSGSVKDELKGLETEEKFIEHLEKRDWSKVDEEKEKLASKVGDLSDHLAKLEKFCQGAIVTINEIRDKLK